MIPKKYSKTILIFSALFAYLLFGLLACATMEYKPIPSQSIAIEDGYAVLRTDSLLIAIRPQALQGESSSINSDFFSIYIQIRNRSPQNISISPTDFVILAQTDQYDAIPIERIIEATRINQFVDMYNNPFAVGERTYNPDRQQQILYSLMQNAFSFNPIVSGGTKSGYLFYSGNLYKSKSFIIKAFGKEIEFHR